LTHEGDTSVGRRVREAVDLGAVLGQQPDDGAPAGAVQAERALGGMSAKWK
jgi:hypothetical protein